MSRIGKAGVSLSANAKASILDNVITVTGPLGCLVFKIHPIISVVLDEAGVLTFVQGDNSSLANAMQGTMRAIVANMVLGVVSGFEKKLLLVGVGYKAQVNNSTLRLQLGFSHDVEYSLPDNIKAQASTQTEIIIKGIDKQLVGQVAAEIRSFRPPEPYKGKGVRYSDEVIKLKETKKK